MTRYFFSILFSIFILAITSCDSNYNKYAYKKPPTNITELQSAFNLTELTTEINKHDDTLLTIVATGHLYPLIGYPTVYESFIATVKAQNPDYVFVLGDVVRDDTQEEWDQFFDYFKDFKGKLYLAAGNHDLNYHYERYNGNFDHQFEAEQCFLKNVGYRYKTLKDNVANYVFINLNDSIDRVLEYLEIAEKELDTTKPMLLFSGQAIWHKAHQDPNNPKTWTQKSFTRDEILPHIQQYDYLIHGDWNLKFKRAYFPKEDGQFHVLSVGNRKIGDPFFVARLELSQDTIISQSINVPIAKESAWFEKKKK